MLIPDGGDRFTIRRLIALIAVYGLLGLFALLG